MTSIGDRVTAALAKQPAAAQPVLRGLVLDPSFRGVVSSSHAADVARALGIDETEVPLALVPLAACYALPPISTFCVGAVGVGTRTGNLYFGANMEFPGAVLTASVHAEQAVTTNAWINGEEGLTTIAVSDAPCGYCRQFLYELTTAKKLRIVTAKHGAQALTALLRKPFGPEDLGKTERLMAPEEHELELVESSDPVVAAALAAASRSYAPYSGGLAGVALETAAGAIYEGRYAENAAYNPSMSPLASAITMWRLAGARDSIARAVLVQVPSPVDHVATTKVLLEAGAPAQVELEVYVATVRR